MSFLLQDEPEKGRRWLLLLIGAVVGVIVWGGGLYAASSIAPPPTPRARPIQVRMVVAPPSAAPPTAAPKAPVTQAPPTAAPATQAPKPVAKTSKPKPKKRRRTKRRKPRPKKTEVADNTPPPATPEPAKPQTPTSAPPSPAPVQLGMTFDSTAANGRGPAVQVGNHLGGYGAGRAKAPVRSPAPGGNQLTPGRPEGVRESARVRKKVRPKYTRAALRANVEGKVLVAATIGADGRVLAVRLIKGLGYGLDEHALDAVKQWRFHPATLDGAPIKSRKRITVHFVIES